MGMGKKDPRVDAYIKKSAGFARPILTHLRGIVHAGCPGVEATLNDRGVKVPRRARPRKPPALGVPDYFMNALLRNRKALATFEEFNYSRKKDYVEGVTEAKRDETRTSRLETAVAWMAEGKDR